MRALVITRAGHAEVQNLPSPMAAPGEVVVDIRRVGICGTDLEFFAGDMAYLRSGHERYPVRIGHEWMGVVTSVGHGVDSGLIGARVTGDTMLGCGNCRRCHTGRQHVCESRREIGIRGGRPGALAEQLAVPATALHLLPDTVDDTAGALVEPGGNAWRAVQAAGLTPGDSVLITGTGTIGLLCAMFVRAAGATPHLLGREEKSLDFARSLGLENAWTADRLPIAPWDAVIEATNSSVIPPQIIEWAEPGTRVVYIGVASESSMIDTRRLVLRDITAVGILSASPGLAATISSYATGEIDPRPLVAATVPLESVPAILAGRRPAGAGGGPKFHAQL